MGEAQLSAVLRLDCDRAMIFQPYVRCIRCWMWVLDNGTHYYTQIACICAVCRAKEKKAIFGMGGINR